MAHRAFAAASTSSAWPGTFTFGQILAIRPSLSIRTVVRSIPIYLPAVHALLDPNPVGLQHSLVLVRREGEVEPIFRAELVVARDAVGRNADDLGVGLRKLRSSAPGTPAPRCVQPLVSSFG